MYEYRLTKRGKIVITTFIIILFSVTGLLSMKIVARAQNNSADKPPVSAGFEAHGFVYKDFSGEKPDEINIGSNVDLDNSSIEKNYETGSSDEEMDINYSHTDDKYNNFLSVEAEKAYVYEGRKIAFLTFDDGPSKNITPKILDVLDEYNVKATFFIIGSLSKSNSAILKDIANRGHAIGIHTYSHNYNLIYKSTDNFTSELKMTEDVLKQTLGDDFHTRLFRFPGGSFEGYKKQYKDMLENFGYLSIDWNAVTGDGEHSGLPPQKLLDRLKATSEGKHQLVVLMHDSSGKQTTVDALPGIIEFLKSQGYEFAVLN
jgi:peptidoglycan/xylan/chitin deacetylase (PgdA/CDA1 family)